KGFATNSAFFWTERTSVPYEGFQRGRRWDYKNEDIEYIRLHVPEVEYLSPRLFGWAQSGDNTVRGERSAAFTIYGDYPDYFKIDRWTPLCGRLLNEIDVWKKRKVCVIGERVQEMMFDPEEDPVGKYLKLSGVYFQVVGVIHPETRINIGGEEKEETIIIPFSTMQATYNYGNVIHFFSVTAKPGYSVSFMEEKLERVLKERHKIAPEDMQAVGSFNIEAEFKKFTSLFTGIRLLTWIVGIGTLIAGMIGVSNIMLVIIRERTQEIGIQRAIGATPAKIILHIVAESVFLTVLAGYIGLSLGVGLLEMLNRGLEAAGDEVFFRNPQVNLGMALGALSVLVLAGIGAGLIPARHAVRIKPIDALRDE
ncbi:MAG: ABC transporter permease, partial [Mangrovibacterium sp.]